ncbi:hypothetical protein GCM10023081_40120 [Arthrobacter ginkgonis]|uniref:Uncharacterized protein n=1 Tax=Arthrobacter ginkgonis TaxID=1630594 RepID=A0ABP7D4H6_9MICC
MATAAANTEAQIERDSISTAWGGSPARPFRRRCTLITNPRESWWGNRPAAPGTILPRSDQPLRWPERSPGRLRPGNADGRAREVPGRGSGAAGPTIAWRVLAGRKW